MLMRLVFAIFLLLPACANAYYMGARITAPAQPAIAATWGYNSLTFWDDFNSITTIDINNTLAPGYKWYMQGTPSVNGGAPRVQAASSVSVSNSILTFTPVDDAGPGGPLGGSLVFPGYKGLSAPRYTGSAIAPTGFYAEARIRYNPALQTGGFPNRVPAFWFIDAQLGLNVADNNNTLAQRLSEFDVIEANPTGGSSVTNVYCLFDYTALNSSHGLSSCDMGVTPPIDGQFHTYGLLWVPQVLNSGTGLVQRYIDGVHKTAGDVSYSSSTISPQAAGGATTGWMSGADTSVLGQVMRITGPPSWPIDVDYVQVWQP